LALGNVNSVVTGQLDSELSLVGACTNPNGGYFDLELVALKDNAGSCL